MEGPEDFTKNSENKSGSIEGVTEEQRTAILESLPMSSEDLLEMGREDFGEVAEDLNLSPGKLREILEDDVYTTNAISKINNSQKEGLEEQIPEYFKNISTFVDSTSSLKSGLLERLHDEKYLASLSEEEFAERESKLHVFDSNATEEKLEKAETRAYNSLDEGNRILTKIAFKELIQISVAIEVQKNIASGKSHKRALENAKERVRFKYSNIEEAMAALHEINYDDVFGKAEITDEVNELLKKFEDGTISDEERNILMRIDKAARGIVYRSNEDPQRIVAGYNLPKEYTKFIYALSKIKKKNIEGKVSGAVGSAERFSVNADNPLQRGAASRPRRSNDELERF